MKLKQLLKEIIINNPNQSMQLYSNYESPEALLKASFGDIEAYNWRYPVEMEIIYDSEDKLNSRTLYITHNEGSDIIAFFTTETEVDHMKVLDVMGVLGGVLEWDDGERIFINITNSDFPIFLDGLRIDGTTYLEY